MATVHQLKIKYDLDKFKFFDAKSAARFPLEDKHVVNEHHVLRKCDEGGGRKGLQPAVLRYFWCDFAVYFNSRYCGFKSLSGLRTPFRSRFKVKKKKCLRR